MFTIHTTKQFQKDYKLCIKRNLNLKLINSTFEMHEKTDTLPPKYKPHKLRGNFEHHWECHIQAD